MRESPDNRTGAAAAPPPAAADFDRIHQAGLAAALGNDPSRALELFDVAVTLNPQSAAAHCHRGNALDALGRREQALASYERALAIDATHAAALGNRGVVLYALERYPEALASYERALVEDPQHVPTLYNRGNALQALGRFEEALENYDRVLALKPDHVKALTNRGNALHTLKRYDEALQSFDRAITLDPAAAEALNNRGNLLREMGNLEGALASHRAFLALCPDSAFAHHVLVFTLLRASADPAETFAQARIFDSQFAPGRAHAGHRNTRDPDRRLKIGYVSPDLREHPVAFHLAPILANHDPDQVEVFCYSSHEDDDATTSTLKSLATHWRRVADLDDTALAALVTADAIDILVDLAGHTTQSRLAAFAHKPAPVQLTWLGLPGTTGLSAIDYRLTDRHVDPPGMTERHHSETLVRLTSHACYQAPAPLPPVNDLPALRRGFVTFASFNSIDKLTARTSALWAKVLKEVPGSRLLMSCEAGIARIIERRFTALGIDAARLTFIRRVSLADYFRWHHTVDIVLDTFPFNGGTVTRNALWMGVPAVTRAGSAPVSRVGLALMSQIGLESFVAATDEEYVAIARRWTNDLDGLAAVRTTLRERMQAAFFSDGPAYTRELEAVYRRLWRTWCAR